MEGSVSWNDYCPRCETSTRTNFGFGKIKLCNNCLKALEQHEQEIEMKRRSGGYI